ncbi:alpha-amylase [Pseudobacter ginsenosidimutans]|uniref:Alpha-amylase n=1 Tax=Pseudobacter ginsenosidimutans TaxID=661488 RepID=A0A4Q7MYR3_9BACT|nr:alpha-amylase [Pseudobacter ginsenosidimutans]QEC43030.1 alpha-amylase [Pseudobacter ginsenosidimutans]RZS74381.1 alpha-amylase [Pseudobacter ginsenosidimutans]
MEKNSTLFQFFHWYYPDDGSLWDHCREQAAHLASLGVTHVWLPPAYKSANGTAEPGYAVYDLFDLGEFDQKGTVRTKYGTKEQYLQCIKALHDAGIQAIADLVLNHKQGADEQEHIMARRVNAENRNEIYPESIGIDAFTKFTFPGRKGKYSNYIWNHDSFTAVSLGRDNELQIYLLEHQNGQDGWEQMMDGEKGNFDYLMGSDIAFDREFVREELKHWIKWYIETTGADGFRLDAVKHITVKFFKEFIPYIREVYGRDFFCIAEYWSHNKDSIIQYCNELEQYCLMYDVPLHFNMYEASMKKKDYDLRTMYQNTILEALPDKALTFVNNHDSQPHQSLESWVDYWFMQHAYAFVLLREKGVPCVFYPDLYGARYETNGHNIEHVPVFPLGKMMQVRHKLSYGEQEDHFDHPNTIGWVRKGVEEMEFSGCAIVLCNGEEGDKLMNMGPAHANKTFIDSTGNRQDKVQTDEHGQATFKANGESVSVWVREEAMAMLA